MTNIIKYLVIGGFVTSIFLGLWAYQLAIQRGVETREAVDDLAAVIASSDQSIVLVCRVEEASGCIEITSPVADRMFGYDDNELIGQPVDILLIPEERGRKFVNFVEQIGTAAQVTKATGLTKNGDSFPIVIFASPLSKDRFLTVITLGVQELLID